MSKGTIFKQHFRRTLANGQRGSYTSRVWLCRFYANGRMYRLSTGVEDPEHDKPVPDCARCIKAQSIVSTWAQQARTGQALQPPPPRNGGPAAIALQNLAHFPPMSPSLHRTDLVPFLLAYIPLRRTVGASADDILIEVTHVLRTACQLPDPSNELTAQTPQEGAVGCVASRHDDRTPARPVL